MKLLKNIFLVSATTVLAGCATNMQPEQQAQMIANLTPDHFYRSTIVKDDSLDVTATVSSQNGYQTKKGLLGVVWEDNFLRAFIDKRSGQTTYQLYQMIKYNSPSWRFYQQINYETPSGPVSKPVTIISRDVVSCANARYSGCLYAEHMAIELDESLLRTISKTANAGHPVAWRFKFIAKNAPDFQEGLLPAEVAGFLKRVDEYKALHNLK